ncbi:MAG: hypothetical protein ACSHX8_08525 [Opitutaceae bacterium]
MTEKNSRRSREDVKEDLCIVRHELNQILDHFREKDRSLDSTRDVPVELEHLGSLPIQQNQLTAHICDEYKLRWQEGSVSRSAILAKVQRVANELKKKNSAVQDIFRFKSHHTKRGGPTPSRVSQADAIEKIHDRLKELEEFQRRFKHMLQSGRPEPETPPNAEADQTN